MEHVHGSDAVTISPNWRLGVPGQKVVSVKILSGRRYRCGEGKSKAVIQAAAARKIIEIPVISWLTSRRGCWMFVVHAKVSQMSMPL